MSESFFGDFSRSPETDPDFPFDQVETVASI